MESKRVSVGVGRSGEVFVEGGTIAEAWLVKSFGGDFEDVVPFRRDVAICGLLGYTLA